MGLFKREHREAAAPPEGALPTQPSGAPAHQASVSGPPAQPQPAASSQPSSTVSAQPAASSPGAAPLAPPAGDGELKKLGDQLSSLTKLVQSEQEAIKGFQTKVGSMEERMRFLQHVSEVISMNYNPFLEQEEGAVFEGLRPRLDLPDGPAFFPPPAATNGVPAPEIHAQRAPAASTHVGDQGSVAIRRTPGLPVGVELVPVPAPESALAPAEGHPAHATVSGPSAEGEAVLRELAADGGSSTGSWDGDVAAARPEEAIPVHLHRNEAPTSGSGHGGGAVSARPPRGLSVPLASTVALAWFEHLLRHAPARALHDLLDFYHGVGWVPDDGHAWLAKLASGVTARPRTPADRRARRAHEGKRRGPSPLERVALHRASLRFAERLFGPRVPEAERALLEHELRAGVR